MFISLSDWELDSDVAGAAENAKGFWPEMKKHGAINMRATVTGENTIRTMTVWGSKEKLEAAVDDVKAAASKAVGMTMTGGMLGELAVELD